MPAPLIAQRAGLLGPSSQGIGQARRGRRDGQDPRRTNHQESSHVLGFLGGQGQDPGLGESSSDLGDRPTGRGRIGPGIDEQQRASDTGPSVREIGLGPHLDQDQIRSPQPWSELPSEHTQALEDRQDGP